MSLAETSECRNRHGAVIVRGGSVIATGVNRDRNHPTILGSIEVVRTSASIHAEVAALRQLNHVVQPNAVCYIARVNRQGKPMMSRPCNACIIALAEYGIKEVVYTLSEN